MIILNIKVKMMQVIIDGGKLMLLFGVRSVDILGDEFCVVVEDWEVIFFLY